MEALRKLERVQRMLSFMEARGLSFNDPGSDRFLAHFLLFLVQPCGTVSMEKRCNLISELLQKQISAKILEDALFFVTEEGNYMLENKLNLEVHLNLAVLCYYHCCHQVLMVHMSKIKLPIPETTVADWHSLSMTKEVLILHLLLLNCDPY